MNYRTRGVSLRTGKTPVRANGSLADAAKTKRFVVKKRPIVRTMGAKPRIVDPKALEKIDNLFKHSIKGDIARNIVFSIKKEPTIAIEDIALRISRPYQGIIIQSFPKGITPNTVKLIFKELVSKKLITQKK
ncbi:MAG TPA: hypothetical protein PKK60_02160 [archaeon]|nr:hypothetical protein [archaeon]